MPDPRIVQHVHELEHLLRQGHVVAVPTDTVMGLVSLPTPEATRHILSIKGRPAHKPLILFVHRDTLLQDLPEPREPVELLIQTFWPGPLTLVLHLTDATLPPSLRNREGGIGVRHPGEPFPERLLETFKEGLASTSANRSGARPAVTPDEVRQIFKNTEVAAVLNRPSGGQPPSTLLDLTTHPPRILRAGPISLRALEHTLKQEIQWSADRPFRVLTVCSGNTCRSPMAEHLLRHALADIVEKGRLKVVSAGTLGLSGGDATPEVYQVLQEIGIDVPHHTRTPLTPDLIQQADLILAMEPQHLEAIRALGGEDRAALIAEAPVPDPIGLGLPTYRMVRDMLRHAIEERWAPYLRRKLESSA